MIEILKLFGLVSIGSFSIVGLIGYVTKNLFEKYLESQIESHKHTLELITIEHQIRFSELHKERATLIKDFYSKIIDFKVAISVFIKYVETDRSEDAKRILHTWGAKTAEIGMLYDNNRIYFNQNSCELIDKLMIQIKSLNEGLMVLLRNYTVADLVNNVDNKKQEFLTLTQNAKETIIKRIDPVIKELEIDFRKMLGVKN